MSKVLITDTLFVFPEHEAKLKAAGLEVVRAKGDLGEAELIEAIKGVDGYILGGVEHVTTPIIEAADKLKALAFTGADWASFIPGHELATQKSIKITNTPGTTTPPVSEFTVTLMLVMLRHVFELGGPGKESFMTSKSLADVRVGIVGMGRIGERVARMLLALGVQEIWYWNRTRKTNLESELGIRYAELKDLFAQCDVITNHLSSQAGELIGKELLDATKEGVLIINTGGRNSFNVDALYNRISQHGARAAFDIEGGVKDDRFTALPLSSWYITNNNTAFNTQAMLNVTSDMVTDSMINVLTKGTDQYVVNG